MSFIQMSVPLVFWGRQPPSHKITCICRSEERKGVATGSQSGQICLWDVYRDHETERIRVSHLNSVLNSEEEMRREEEREGG